MGEVGHNAGGVQGDVANMLDLDLLYKTVRQEAGRIDVLFANAGGGEFAALPDVTEEHFDRTFATNVKGTLFTVQKALPLLRNGASVILTGSTNGTKGGASFSVYSASKAAIRNFARSWVQDLASRHIRVNVLVPGATSTPGLHGLSSSEDADRTLVSLMEAQIPLGRMGKPEETAAAAFFWRPTTAASSTAANCSSMGDRSRSRSNAQVSANQSDRTGTARSVVWR